jgi:sulfatase modifying factor 1
MKTFSRALLLATGLLLLATPAWAVEMDWVFVGNPSNPPKLPPGCWSSRTPDSSAKCGVVTYDYWIGTYEVTNTQYAAFLNAKAASDPYELYNPEMESNPRGGGIVREGSDGSYSYSVKAGFEDRPATWVSFFDAVRFVNWLDNGQAAGDTETGAYTLLGGTAIPSNWQTIVREPTAIAFLPNEAEWWKAAYFDPVSETYFDYPTRSNTPPTCSAPTSAPNSANCGLVVGDTTDVGSYPNSASPYGTFDQAGNVWEWTEETYEFFPPGSEGLRLLVSGGARTPADELEWSWWFLEVPSEDFWTYGFRVGTYDPEILALRVIPEPGTSLLLMAGLAALAARSSRRG